MATEGTSTARGGAKGEDVDALLERLALHEDDGEEFVWEEESDLPDVQAK